MRDKLTHAIDDIIKEVLLLEDPDTVTDQSGMTIVRHNTPNQPAIAFFCINDESIGKKKFFFYRNDNGSAAHNKIKQDSTPDFPDPWAGSDRFLRGRAWTKLKILSFYSSEQEIQPYFKEIEDFFTSELHLNINEFNVDFGGSSEIEGLKPWPGNGVVKSAPKQLTPEQEQTVKTLNKQIAELQATLHLKRDEERDEVEDNIRILKTNVADITGGKPPAQRQLSTYEQDELNKIDQSLEDLYSRLAAGVPLFKRRRYERIINKLQKQRKLIVRPSRKVYRPEIEKQRAKGGGGALARYAGSLPALQEQIRRLLKEDPDTVYGTDGTELAFFGEKSPAIAWYCIEDASIGKKKFFFIRNNTGAAYHSDIKLYATPDFPNPFNSNSNDRFLRGRAWTTKMICSFYASEDQIRPYFKEIEEFFQNELNLNINDFKIEFGTSARREGLKPWPGSVQTTKSLILSPEEQAKVDEINKKIAELQATLHLKTGSDKKAVEDEIEELEKSIGKISNREASKAAYRKTGAEKIAPFEKGAGSYAGYKGRLPAIAEEKVQIYNKTLCPDLWQNENKLNPEVKTALLKIAFDFYVDTELKSKVQDVCLLGSGANYNWTSQSDLDVHIVVDSVTLSMHPENSEKFFRSLSGRWNLEHEVKVKGHKVELYIQDAQENNSATGVYSLIHDDWVKKPSPENINVDKLLIQKKYSTWVEKIDNAIKQEDEKMLKRILDGLREYRQAGLDKQGEFSSENLVFKILRSRGYLEKIKQCYNKIYDKKMTVKDCFDPTSAGPNPAATEGQPQTGTFYKDLNSKMRKMEEGKKYDGNSRSWMDSSGKFHPTERHLIGARELLGEPSKPLSPGGEEDDIDYDRTASALFNKGFLRITETPNIIYATGKVSSGQLKLLKDKAIERHKNLIYNGKEFNFQTGDTVKIYQEVTQRDIKSTLPNRAIDLTDIPFDELTMDNLMGLKNKIERFYNEYMKRPERTSEEQEGMRIKLKALYLIKQEIKDRSKFINKGLEESTIDWVAWDKEKNANTVSIPIPGTNMRMAAKMRPPSPGEKTKSKMVGFGGDRDQAYGKSSEPRHFEEGYGAGNPEEDRLKIINPDGSTRRWQVKSKNASKTPKIVEEMINKILKETFLGKPKI
jgi:polyhydroxyalkanoate synthesis regulator phasin